MLQKIEYCWIHTCTDLVHNIEGKNVARIPHSCFCTDDRHLLSLPLYIVLCCTNICLQALYFDGRDYFLSVVLLLDKIYNLLFKHCPVTICFILISTDVRIPNLIHNLVKNYLIFLQKTS